MSETAELTPLEAARVLAKARDYDEDLRARTGGLTWMIWGFVSAGIFLTYSLASVSGGEGWAMGFLWLPWVVAGIVAMNALWRSAALSSRRIATFDPKGFWLRFLLITAGYGALLYVLRPDTPAKALIFMGLGWAATMALGYLPRMRGPRAGWLGLVVPGLLVALGVAILLAGLPIAVEGWACIAAAGGIPFLGGLWQTRWG